MLRVLFTCLSLILVFSVCTYAQQSHKILFVGNSLTYSNDLPKQIVEEAAKRGIILFTNSLTRPNYSIADHWAEGKLQHLIRNGDFEFVVVQQGPSSQSDGREMLLTYGQYLSELCSKHGAKLAFFMVWPARSNFHTFDGVIRNYTEAARATGAILCPVGEVWKAHFEKTGDFSYYSQDGFHPSELGTNVAAEIIVNCLFPN